MNAQNIVRPLLIFFPIALCLLFPLFITYETNYAYVDNIFKLYIIISFTIGSVVIRILKCDKMSKLGAIDFTIVTYTLYINFNTLFHGQNPLLSEEHLILVCTTIVYLMIRSDILKFSNLSFLLKFMVCIGLIITIKGLLEYANNYSATRGQETVLMGFGNSNIAASYLTIIIPFALAIVGNKRNALYWRLSGLVYVLACIFLMGLLLSRIALATTCGTILVFASHYFRWKISKRLIICLTILFLSSIAFLTTIKTDSSKGRLLIWKISTNIALDHALMGVGYSRFLSNYNNYQAQYFSSSRPIKEQLLAGENNYAFNDLLKIQIESGIVGTTLFLLMLCQVIRLTYLKWGVLNTYNKSLFYSFVAVIVIGLVSYPFDEPAILITFYILLGVYIHSLHKVTGPNYKMSPRLKIAVLLTLSISVTYLLARAEKIKIWINTSDKDRLQKEKIYTALYKEFRENSLFLADFGKMRYQSNKRVEGIQLLEQAEKLTPNLFLNTTLGNAYFHMGNMERAEFHFVKACRIVPSKFATHFLLFKFYGETNQVSKYKRIGFKILNMPVKIPSGHVEEIKKEVFFNLHSAK